MSNFNEYNIRQVGERIRLPGISVSISERRKRTAHWSGGPSFPSSPQKRKSTRISPSSRTTWNCWALRSRIYSIIQPSEKPFNSDFIIMFCKVTDFCFCNHLHNVLYILSCSTFEVKITPMTNNMKLSKILLKPLVSSNLQGKEKAQI